MRNKNLLVFIFLFSIANYALCQVNFENNIAKNRITNTSGAKNISRTFLLSADSIENIISGFEKDVWTIVALKITVALDTVDYSEYNLTGNKLTPEIKSRIKSAAPGSLLFFEGIHGRMKNSHDLSTRAFPYSSYFITD